MMNDEPSANSGSIGAVGPPIWEMSVSAGSRAIRSTLRRDAHLPPSWFHKMSPFCWTSAAPDTRRPPFSCVMVVPSTVNAFAIMDTPVNRKPYQRRQRQMSGITLSSHEPRWTSEQRNSIGNGRGSNILVEALAKKGRLLHKISRSNEAIACLERASAYFWDARTKRHISGLSRTAFFDVRSTFDHRNGGSFERWDLQVLADLGDAYRASGHPGKALLQYRTVARELDKLHQRSASHRNAGVYKWQAPNKRRLIDWIDTTKASIAQCGTQRRRTLIIRCSGASLVLTALLWLILRRSRFGGCSDC